MAYPTSSNALILEDIDRQMVAVKLYAQQVRAECAAGNVPSSRILDRLNDWSGGKPIYLFVETCTQGKPYAMTADQWEAEVRHASDYCKKSVVFNVKQCWGFSTTTKKFAAASPVRA